MDRRPSPPLRISWISDISMILFTACIFCSGTPRSFPTCLSKEEKGRSSKRSLSTSTSVVSSAVVSPSVVPKSSVRETSSSSATRVSVSIGACCSSVESSLVSSRSSRSSLPFRIRSNLVRRFCVTAPSFRRANSRRAVLCKSDLARSGS